MRLINEYIQLQKSCFSQGEGEPIYYYEEYKNMSLLEMHNRYSKNCCFNIIIVSQKSTLIISNFNHNCTGTIMTSLNSSVLEGLILQSFTLLCRKEIIPVWSSVFNLLIENLKSIGIDVQLIEYNSVFKIKKLDVSVSDNERRATFKKYISTLLYCGHTKDSNFILKDTFNYWDEYNPNHKNDENLIFYLNRNYNNFVYGYIDLSKIAKEDTIFNFWFKDLFLTESDIGIGHLRYSYFYFVIAYKDSKNTKNAFEELSESYPIKLIQYSRGPMDFVKEFMHYKSEISFLNHYFIGIFNNENWVIFYKIFQKIKQKVDNDLSSAEVAIDIEDNFSVDEKYYLRFAYFLYTFTHYDNYRRSFQENNVPWFSTPKFLYYFKEIEELVPSLYKNGKMENSSAMRTDYS